VAAYALLLGRRSGLEGQDLQRLELGALLHDIGKIGIPQNVLLKPGPLDPEEWAMIRDHTRLGYRLLAPFKELQDEAELVYSHHERYDGTGYPRGLKKKQIPLGARIFAIVDTLDAIASDRPYRAGRDLAAARQEIARQRGRQFDPGLVDTFLAIPDPEFESIQSRYAELPAVARAAVLPAGANPPRCVVS
jgi:HD-GYP domain-containing protein (c-di-GMP phosphodiesterase class II)